MQDLQKERSGVNHKVARLELVVRIPVEVPVQARALQHELGAVVSVCRIRERERFAHKRESAFLAMLTLGRPLSSA